MQWIDVKDILPTSQNKWIVCLINNKPIIAQVHDATFCLTSKLSFHWPTNKWIMDDFFNDVTHWMPVPESPKE